MEAAVRKKDVKEKAAVRKEDVKNDSQLKVSPGDGGQRFLGQQKRAKSLSNEEVEIDTLRAKVT